MKLPTPVVEVGDEPPEVEYETKSLKPAYMILEDELTKMETIPKLNYVGVIVDCVYEMDYEEVTNKLSEAELIKFIDAFAALTTAPDWSVVIFCGFAQQSNFLKILESKCNGGAQRIWWHKKNASVGANKNIRYNVLEAAVIAFHMADVEPGVQSTRKSWMADFDLDIEHKSRANVLKGFSVVKQPFRLEGKVVCAHQKPQHLLEELINCHMMGPAPFTGVTHNAMPDSSTNWILDAGCGVATATVAALRCGLNAVAFDKDPDMVSAATQRLGNIDKEVNGNTECMSLEETKALEKEKEQEEQRLEEAEILKGLELEAEGLKNVEEEVDADFLQGLEDAAKTAEDEAAAKALQATVADPAPEQAADADAENDEAAPMAE